MTLPNFVIAGTARSGTTSLYHYLKQHPEIGFPSKKEPKFFSSLSLVFPHKGVGDETVDQLVVRSFEGYLELYRDMAAFKRIGDASSDYLYHHRHAAPEIRRVLGDVPIIICLRNPVDRAISAYNNMLRDQRETLDFRSALNAEESRLEENWDWMWAYKAGGLYAEQVETYLTTFSQVKVVLFEEMVEGPEAVLRSLLEFLGVDPNIPINASIRYGNSGKPKNRIIGYLTNRENVLVFRLRSYAIKLFSRSFLERIASWLLKKESINAVDKDQLREFFSQDVDILEKLIDRDLGLWK